jgi:hypothetical protein
MRPSSPGKVRKLGGESHNMSPGEMKERYLLAEEGIQASKMG